MDRDQAMLPYQPRGMRRAIALRLPDDRLGYALSCASLLAVGWAPDQITEWLAACQHADDRSTIVRVTSTQDI